MTESLPQSPRRAMIESMSLSNCQTIASWECTTSRTWYQTSSM
jgi:hypothetical protein